MSKHFLTDVSYPKGYTLTKIIPPRVGGKTFQGTSNLLAAVSREGHPLSLEIVGTGHGVALMHRAAHDDTLFSSMMWTHFPSAIVEAVPSDADHLLVGPDEAAWTCILKVEGAALPSAQNIQQHRRPGRPWRRPDGRPRRSACRHGRPRACGHQAHLKTFGSRLVGAI